MLKTFTVFIGSIAFDEVRAEDFAAAEAIVKARDYGVSASSVWVKNPAPVKVRTTCTA